MTGKKFLVAAVLSAAVISGGTMAGTVSAADYPPDALPPTTVLATSSVGDPGDPGDPIGLRSPLANTGSSDTARVMEIGGVAIAAGAGLLLVAKRRRRVAAT